MRRGTGAPAWTWGIGQVDFLLAATVPAPDGVKMLFILPIWFGDSLSMLAKNDQ